MVLTVALATATLVEARDPRQAPTTRQFAVGQTLRVGDLPAGRFRGRVEGLPPVAQERALRWLESFHFTEQDTDSLQVDDRGGVAYACVFPASVDPEPAGSEPAPPPVEEIALPISPFPDTLKFHSRPGAPNVLYLNFEGETVTGTDWNASLGRDPIRARPFSTDTDITTFSDTEQAMIKQIWQRMAEDFAPFDINVTTERPATFTSRTAVALITRNTDLDGNPNPYSTAGGVAYVNVFGSSTFAAYSPAWVYHNNLSNNQGNIAEAASHEIGHNLGLSHDGKTDGTAYYSGHGSGEISWGTLMGTGYNRSVSQWSKGDYYLANNLQDDLATIAGKLSYRADDHSSTQGSATPLLVSGGTNIAATTPETDPQNNNPSNKGVIERETDVDVFSFITGTGPVSLTVTPWVTPAGTRGNNLDLSVALYNEAGQLVVSTNPATLTSATLQAQLTEGRYYLHVRNSGAGDPLVSPPTGYTAYGSLGQYFISGTITDAGLFNPAPQAELQPADLTAPDQATHTIQVTYYDNLAIDVASVGAGDLRVTGPAGYARLGQLVSVSPTGNGSPRTATYSVTAPDLDSWKPSDNGMYTVTMEPNQVRDTEGAWVPGGVLGAFQVSIPATIYSATMDSDPGWTLEPDWQYGVPAYGSGGPTGGATGSKIVAYNLAGNYPNNLSVKHATTPPINTAGRTSLSLRFARWLRLRNNDTATISVSTNGTTWITVWTTVNHSDSAWQTVQYALPEEVAGSSSLRVRWSLASNQNQNDIGWNIDDVEILADGTVDTTPPSAVLTVFDLTDDAASQQAITVTYADETAVKRSSLDSADLLVTGPNGYSNLATFTSADLPLDGSPITAFYSLAAPGATWDESDNGTYTVRLVAGAVADTLNNTVNATLLGTFDVAIDPAGPAILQISPATGFTASGTQGGPFSPTGVLYTLTNAGESPLNWSAAVSENWLSLSQTSGTLAPGASTPVTLALQPSANLLAAGTHRQSVNFVNNSSIDNATVTLEVTLEIAPPPVNLAVSVSHPERGSVSPTGGTFAAGSTVQLVAQAQPYYVFQGWRGDVTASANPLSLVLSSNMNVEAVFGEIVTTSYPTPYWWLAQYGYTSDPEGAVTSMGANGMALWESYIAGLDPTDPASRLILDSQLVSGQQCALTWDTVPGRLYTIYTQTPPLGGLQPLPGAVDMPSTVNSVTLPLGSPDAVCFFGISVRLP